MTRLPDPSNVVSMFGPRVPREGVVHLPLYRSVPPIDLERAARATRDAGMQTYFDQFPPREGSRLKSPGATPIDLYAQFRPEPSLWQRIKAMREDVPEAVRLVLGDIRAAPQSHALVAIAAFNLPLLALLIGAWWVGALS
jgi:hypothetical protein